jgi:hypothetical protein
MLRFEVDLAKCPGGQCVRLLYCFKSFGGAIRKMQGFSLQREIVRHKER